MNNVSNIAELLRLLHNLIRLGTIAEVDHHAARVRVKTGELLTDWLPWLEGRAGTTRDWDPPTQGEQVILFSPGGDPAAGVVLCGLCSNAHPGLFEYDHANSVLRIRLPGAIEISAPGGTTWQGNIQHTGELNRQGGYQQQGGGLTHNGKNVGHDHAHSGIQPGPANTQGPI